VINLIRSEFIKFRSVRSTLLVLGAGGALVILVAILQAVQINADADHIRAGAVSQTLGDLTGGVSVALFLFGALGVQVIGQEYRFNTIRTTFAAAPIRWRVLVAKLMVVTLAVAAVSLAMMGVCAAIGAAMLPRFTVDGLDQRVVLGTVLFGMGWAAMGLGVGAIVRQPVAGILILLGEALVAENIIVNLFHSSAPWLPFQNGYQMTLRHSGGDGSGGQAIVFRSVLGGGIYFFIITAIVLGIGLYLANRRDA